MPRVNYEEYLVKKPVYEVGVQAVGKHKGHQVPSMTYMSNALVPGSNTYVEVSWIYDVPTPNIGSDPDNPEDLGGEMTIELEGQPLTFDRTTALFLPKGTKHGPLTWKKVTRPHIEMTVMLGCGDFALAMPGRNPDK